jgi:hypothetical protein
MSTSALLASLAILYGIAQADPAVFTISGADPTGAVSEPASVAAGLRSISLSNPDHGAGMATAVTGRAMHEGAGITDAAAVTTAAPAAAAMQPFDTTVRAGLNGLDRSDPCINGAGTLQPGAAITSCRQSLFTGLSFSFGAELYAWQPDPVSVAPESTTQATIIGVVGIGFMPYLVARAMLSQPDRFAFSVRPK